MPSGPVFNRKNGPGVAKLATGRIHLVGGRRGARRKIYIPAERGAGYRWAWLRRVPEFLSVEISIRTTRHVLCLISCILTEINKIELKKQTN